VAQTAPHTRQDPLTIVSTGTGGDRREKDAERGTGAGVTGETAGRGKGEFGKEREDSISKGKEETGKGKEEATGEAMGPGRQEVLTCVRSFSLTGEAKHPALPLHDF
jgi:hypothetical protein